MEGMQVEFVIYNEIKGKSGDKDIQTVKDLRILDINRTKGPVRWLRG